MLRLFKERDDMGNPDGAEFLKILKEIVGGTAEALSSVREWEADAMERGDEEAAEALSRMRSDIDHYGGATQDRIMSVLRRMMGEFGPMGLFALIISGRSFGPILVHLPW